MDLPEFNDKEEKIPKLNVELNSILNEDFGEIEKYKDTHHVFCLCRSGV